MLRVQALLFLDILLPYSLQGLHSRLELANHGVMIQHYPALVRLLLEPMAAHIPAHLVAPFPVQHVHMPQPFHIPALQAESFLAQPASLIMVALSPLAVTLNATME
jgi:hypothetical protein